MAPNGLPTTAPPQRLDAGQLDAGQGRRREQIDLDTAGNRYRRYLVWITKLPPGEEQAVEISEILLFK